jgi:hypothetical protein
MTATAAAAVAPPVPAAGFPRLCALMHPVDEMPAWPYPSPAPGGTALLRVWATRDGYLAVVTHASGIAPSQAPRQVHAALRSLFPEGDLAVIEHDPAPAADAPAGHWNQLAVDPGGTAYWRRAWPVPPSSPGYSARAAWARMSATQLGIPSQARP